MSLENAQAVQAAVDTSYASMTAVVRGLVAVLACHDTAAPAELDAALKRGAFLRLEFGLGGAGPISFTLHVVRQDGTSAEIVSVQPPATSTRFRFTD